jgi:hypothetical protein
MLIQISRTSLSKFARYNLKVYFYNAMMKKNIYVFIVSLVSFLFAVEGYSQKNKDAIQFTGKVVTSDEKGNVIPLPYTTIAVKGTSRGSSSEIDGYFSFVALKGETIIFSRIGFKSVEYTIPDTMKGDYYSWIQIMSTDNVLLPEVVIYPWPSREHFKQDLLAMDITNELKEAARKNMAQDVLREMRYGVPADGREAASLSFRQTANRATYAGQIAPQRIFDVFAWKQFIEAWKRGDFKKKDKKN